VVNWATGTPGSVTRKVMEKTVGIASERLLPPYARQRFTTWFKKRRRPNASAKDGGSVSVFPTCFVEYMDPAVGQDLVAVFEHNGVECTLPEGTKCCGAPWLHSGNVEQFEEAARRNVTALAAEVRAGRDVVVAQPTCAYVLKRDYPIYVKGAESELVAAHTYDPAEYLMKRHRDADDPFTLATEFPGRRDGTVPDEVTYHVACHLQAQNAGLKSRDLLKAAGVKCSLVQRCSGIDGTWGYRSENYELARQVAAPLAREITAAGNDVVCGDCHLANGAILQETGTKPQHPMQLMALAYGVAEAPQ
jgi:glycerol-3-phosphate dehydrogenase subunit C